MLAKQLLTALFAAAASAATCNRDLVIDNFANFANAVNNLNDATSDDQSMSGIVAQNGVLRFTPKDVNSYFYESFPCVQAKSQGYGGLQFTITYPAGAEFTLEAQSKANCGAATYSSEWFTISGLSGTQQVVTLDLNVYGTSNLDGLVGFVFASFNKVGEYTLSDLKFVCRNLDARSEQEPPEFLPNSASSAALVQDLPSEPRNKRDQASPPSSRQSMLSLSRSSSTTLFAFSSSLAKPNYSHSEFTRVTRKLVSSSFSDSSSLAASRTANPSLGTPSHSVQTTMTIPHSSPPPPRPTGKAANLELLRRAMGASSTTTRRPIISTTTYMPKPSSLAECSDLLIDDWESQSRLTFLYYNSMYQPSSDDGTMKSITVHNDNTVTITPQSTDSYFYSQMPCVDTKDMYGGISMRVKAAPGTVFSIQLASTDNCGSGNFTKTQTWSTQDLGWRFDGSFKSYYFPLTRYAQVDPVKVSMIYFSSLTGSMTLGPMAFYCGNQPSDYRAPSHPVNQQDQYEIPAPASSEGTLLIDRFDNHDQNALNQWHGCDEDCVTAQFTTDGVVLQTNDSDLAWYSSLADKCADITAFANSYLHIPYSGSNQFTISLQQANQDCNPDVAPYPETWDSVEAARYASDTDIYVPIAHFNIDLGRATTFAFKGFYTTQTTTLHSVEIVPSVPAGFEMPNKLPSGNLVFACKRPNSFAFAIDDGDPVLAQEVMEIVKSENIVVTFFTVGLPLEDPSTNLSAVYLDMQARGHQIALHSFTHPKMEGLADYAAIDWEYNNDVAAVVRTFSGMHTPYFRPPFGTEGARMRQRLALALNVTDPYVVMWSVDVEDWKWGLSDTPEKQLDAFKRDLAKGGNLVVMHYLYPNTVKYLRQFIRLAKATGKQLMRVDQCMMDPRAPPL